MPGHAPERRALLSLLQISDSAFPTGAFSHSQSLEAFHAAGELRDAGDLSRLVRLQLGALATSDCIALRVAYGATQGATQGATPGPGSALAVVVPDLLLTATKLTRELREASLATGRKFLRSVRALGCVGKVEELDRLIRDGTADGNLAVCYGVAGSELGVGEEATLEAYLFAGAASLVSAGQKLVPLGGDTAQRVLHELGEAVLRAARDSAKIPVESMHAFAPTVDIRSMHHERQRVRLYIS